MVRRQLLVLLLGCFTITFSLIEIAPAADKPPGFAESAEGIVQALSAPAVAPMRTRGWQPGASQAPARAIQVMAREDGQMVLKQALAVDGQQESASVNLKVEFDVNSYAIRPESYGLLLELAKALRSERLKGRSVVVRGHTDSDGEDAYNLALSLRRAEEVKRYLSSGFGVAEERLRVEGWGEARPFAPNDNPAGKQLNRRVEIGSQPKP